MAARGFFVMIVILEPDQPRASAPFLAVAADMAALIRRSRGRRRTTDLSRFYVFFRQNDVPTNDSPPFPASAGNAGKR